MLRFRVIHGTNYTLSMEMSFLYHAFLRRSDVKKRHLHDMQKVSLTYNPEAPFGLELMAERERRGHVLKCYNFPRLG
jgi:hypothetical protein